MSSDTARGETSSDNQSGRPRSDGAGDRTDLAEDRTLLANERTFGSWMRTALGAVAVGLGFSALFRELQPVWIAKALASSFILIGIFVLWSAERRACHVQKRMNAHEVEPLQRHRLRIITYAMILACACVIAALWLLI